MESIATGLGAVGVLGFVTDEDAGVGTGEFAAAGVFAGNAVAGMIAAGTD